LGGVGYYVSSQGTTPAPKTTPPPPSSTVIPPPSSTVTPAPIVPKEISMYEHCDYGGWEKKFKSGDYPWVGDAGMDNDSASSIKIPSGCTVDIYEHDKYGGRSKSYTSDIACLVADNFNDAISSFKVKCS
jgi:hypothetical protein